MLCFGLAGCAPSDDSTAPADEKPASTLAASAYMDEAAQTLESFTLEQKVAQLFIIRPEDLADESDLANPSSATLRALEQRTPGGICYFDENIVSPDQTRKLLEYLEQAARTGNNLPLLQCVDEEGGLVSRVAGDPNMGVQDVGYAADIAPSGTQGAKTAASSIASYLIDLGFNTDFAPDADVADGADNAIGKRAFGSDAQTVAPLVAAQVKAFANAGVLCCVKHFPGLGGASGDSHDMLIRTDATLEDMQSSEFIPFQAAIEAGVPMVMVGHIACQKVTGDGTPASFSPTVMKLLRDDLGFEGVIVTDSLEMGAIVENYPAAKAAVLALQAGADLVLLPDDYPEAFQGVLDALEDGTITESDIDEHAQRVVAMKLAWQSA